jgi:hypothetical protein
MSNLDFVKGMWPAIHADRLRRPGAMPALLMSSFR